MLTITITTDVVKLSGKLTNLATKQIPFATQEAINRMAYGAQKQVQQELSSHFTIRRQWVSKGIQVNKASKATWPNVMAEVGTKDEFMKRQELGGMKTPRKGGTVAVPVAARPQKTVVTPQSKWPGRLRSSRRQKFFAIKSKAGNRLIMQRVGKGPAGLKVFYMLKKDVNVPKRWNFVQTVEQRVAGNWDKEFGRALAYALATAK